MNKNLVIAKKLVILAKKLIQSDFEDNLFVSEKFQKLLHLLASAINGAWFETPVTKGENLDLDISLDELVKLGYLKQEGVSEIKKGNINMKEQFKEGILQNMRVNFLRNMEDIWSDQHNLVEVGDNNNSIIQKIDYVPNERNNGNSEQESIEDESFGPPDDDISSNPHY